MKNPKGLVDSLVGWAVVGSLFTGALSLIAALFLLITASSTPAAVCLIAAALSFGLLAIAVLGK
ncbi:MAG TPA: hypothetical protein VI776_12895 [Anaerolineales bacterium]|jgi:hypothetical protein|nr:hypothetical protein [Anaerolineales bacterium]